MWYNGKMTQTQQNSMKLQIQAMKQQTNGNKTIVTCCMACDTSHGTKCNKATNKIQRIQWNFELKLPNNETMQTK